MRDHPRGHPEPRSAPARLRSARADGLVDTTIQPGTLFVVATPIGNLEDVTIRALRVLREVELIACEDTRRTRALLARHDVHTPTTSYFEHNKLRKGPELIATLRAGHAIALVTDAGTPGISDPGFLLVRDARAAGVPVVPVPGPSAVVAALSAAGVPADRFVFDGFLPIKGGRRVNRLTALRGLATTIVLYESPHRIAATLGAIRDVFGEVDVVLARELTKQFEEIVSATPSAHLERLGAQGGPRGEFTVVIPRQRGAHRDEDGALDLEDDDDDARAGRDEGPGPDGVR